MMVVELPNYLPSIQPFVKNLVYIFSTTQNMLKMKNVISSLNVFVNRPKQGV
jgi:hypothetical protein